MPDQSCASAGALGGHARWKRVSKRKRSAEMRRVAEARYQPLTYKQLERLRNDWGTKIRALRSDGKIVTIALSQFSKYLREGRASL